MGTPIVGRHKLVVVGRGCRGDVPPTTRDCKQGECHGWGGGGVAAHITASPRGRGALEGAMGVEMMGKDETLPGGVYDV